MFTRKSNSEKTGLEKAIDDIYADMAGEENDTERYNRLTIQLEKLMKLREHDAPRQLVNPDTLIVAGANLLGIAIIVGHERAHVVTSKAINFVMKAK